MLKFVKQIEINLSICTKKAKGEKIPGFAYFNRLFGVTQKPMYFPSIRRVWASKAGIEPRKIVVAGNNTHCTSIQKYLNLPYLRGLGGSRTIDKIAEEIKPNIERVMIILVR